MNTWRDIKTDPPMPDEPVLFTDGNSIFIGRIYHVDKPAVWETYSCRGYSIDGDYPLEGDISLFGISEWQPAPDTWKPEKSADQMFADIGYKPRPVPECVERWTAKMYENESGTMRIEIQYSGFVEARDNNRVCGMTAKEILACAQLIREMQNGSD